ncbi:hypothetical protein HK405_014254, partial [Cladochytrium tenue]
MLLAFAAAAVTATAASAAVPAACNTNSGGDGGYGGVAPAGPKPITLPIGVLESYYYVNVSLGTPPQDPPVKLHIDTGSGPMWVLTPGCEQYCKSAYDFPRGHYNLSASSTGVQSALYESISYLGGYISGYVDSDRVALPCADPGNTTVCDAGPIDFIAVEYSDWSSLSTAGFLGVSPPAQADGNTSIYNAVYRRSVVPHPALGLYLGPAQTSLPSNPSPANDGGALTFGASEETAAGYLGEGEAVRWLEGARDYQGNWTLFMAPLLNLTYTRRGAADGDQASGVLEVDDGAQAIFDTGAGLISSPAGVTAALYAALGLNYTFIEHGGRPLCTDVAAIDANLTFTFAAASGNDGGASTVDVTVRARDLALPGYTEDPYCWPVFNSWDSSNFLMGTVFLKSFYSIFDLGAFVGDGEVVEQTRIGLGKLKDSL